MMVFLVPLSKRCTGAGTIGKIFTSIKVRNVNILDIVMVILCKKVTRQSVLVVKIRSIYGSIEFLHKNKFST